MASSSAPAARPLRIGWASIDLTPDQPVQLHGQMHERISESVHDRITATALAIEGDGGAQAIMISCDLVNVGREQLEQVRQQVAGRVAGFDPSRLLINCTHTHTAPTMMTGLYRDPPAGVMTPAEFTALFVERVSRVAAQAWQCRTAAGISRAQGHAAVGFNRRVVYRDGTAKMYGTSDTDQYLGPEAGEDHGLELLFTWEGDTLTGVIVNIACPSQVVEGQRFVSADFWHPARQEIRRRLGEGVHVYPMCSAAGDLSPRDLVRRGRCEPAMRTVEGMNEMGRRIAVGCDDAFRHAREPIVRELVFRHHQERLSLPKRKATVVEVEAAKVRLEELLRDGEPDPASANCRHVARARKTIERFQTQGDDPRYEADIHILRLGDIAIATNPFELYLEYGQRIKARSKAVQTLVVQLTNDRGIYLPTRRAVAGGHYSAMIADNNCGPEGGDALVERQVALINAMWPEA